MASRRQFLTTGSKLALAAGLLPSVFLDRSLVWATPATSADQLSPGMFRDLVRSNFTVHGKQKSANLKLVKVCNEQVQSIPGTGKLAKFSLLFRGSDQSPLEQETYRFEHAALGKFDVFLVPVDMAGNGRQHYQVVFNQLLA
ncbi:MAG: hypothetical protein HKN21_07435 [Candidatus Eisenbacteria bacterium]|uniref:DUF6916 domain-containing protein n=1 Tax=Eiseniibacteriota bacterium TaxID=2212470 RepID=A0A7Y2H2C4_UNCEI|nr:hypothetical protein [Candidatus Eisenbacteria bacterium]